MIAPSLHRYLYAYQNPTVYVDPDGNESVTQMIDRGAEGCGAWSCAGWATLQAVYQVGTAGFASVHDPVLEKHDRGEISSGEYWGKGVAGGVAVAGVSLATGRVATPFLVGANTTKAVVRIGATTGLVEGVATDALTQGVHISAGVQEEYDYVKTVKSGLLSATIGGGAAGGGKYLHDRNGAGQNSVLVSESDSSIVPNGAGYMGDSSFTPSGSTVHHGKNSTAIGSDDATLGNFKQATDTGDGHNVIVHGERRYDNNGGVFSVDGQPTNSQQIIDAVKSNPNYKDGSPVCLGSCWSGSNGTAQEIANGLKAPVTAPTVPTRFNSSNNKWELMSDDQLPLDVDFTPEWKTLTPESP